VRAGPAAKSGELLKGLWHMSKHTLLAATLA
jgi:hypothetical protein